MSNRESGVSKLKLILCGVLALGSLGLPTTAAVALPAAGLSQRPSWQQEDRENDDARPYRARMRQTGTNAAPGECTGWVDANADSICDNCSHTRTGCTASPDHKKGVDPYAGMPTVSDYEQRTTLENMQAAFNGESNAHAKYLEFAKKADEEGYAGVASLFRAAARAEEIHAQNHAEVIRELGGEAKPVIEKIKVGTTRENLEAAIAGESYEWDVMYTGMLARAQRDRARSALRSFNFAMTAERDHGNLYRQALSDLDSWKEKRDFYVCGVCGKTVAKIDFRKCPSCFIGADEYVKVN